MRVCHLPIVVHALLLLLSAPALADTYTVGPGGPPTYDFAFIQDAIDAASDMDIIYVDPGTYDESIRFWGKVIKVLSTGGPDVTIIDGSWVATTDAVVNFIDLETLKTELVGFTITGGHGELGGIAMVDSQPTLTNLKIVGNDISGTNAYGSAIYCEACAADMKRLHISDNSGGYAPVYITDYSDVLLTNALIAGNDGYAAINQNGWSNSVLDHVTITANSYGPFSMHHADILVRNSIVYPGFPSFGC